jgi:hypothetical protein
VKEWDEFSVDELDHELPLYRELAEQTEKAGHYGAAERLVWSMTKSTAKAVCGVVPLR